MIYIDNISKSYKDNFILNQVNVCFDNKKINLLYGKNGAGKTTLINLIAGIKKEDSGSIFINKEKINFSNGKYKRNIGFVLDFPTYPFHYKVIEYISLLEKIYFISKDKHHIKYKNSLIAFFGLGNFLDEKISNLSTGYLKRVKMFASMIHNPSFYVWDEPFSGIDKDFLDDIVKKIKELSISGKGFLISSHIDTTKLFKNSEVKVFLVKNTKIEEQYPYTKKA